MHQSLQRSRILYISFFLLTGCLCRDLQEVPLCLDETIWPAIASECSYRPAPEWWLQYEDPQLNQWVSWALDCNPSLAQARDRLRVAYADAQGIRARLLPHIDLFGNYSRQRQSLYDVGIPAFVPLVINQAPWFNTATALVEGAYELDIWGKNRASYYAGLSSWQQQRAEEEQVKLTLLATLVSTYLDWQSNLLQLDYLNQEIQVEQQRISLVQALYSHQIQDYSPSLEIDRELSNLEEQKAQLEGAIEIDEHALIALVGRPLSWEPPTAKMDVEECIPESVPLNLIRYRPDLMASLWYIQSQSCQVKVARTQFYPNLNLSGNLGQISFLITKFFTQPATSLLGTAASVLPIYRGGELRAQLAESQALLDTAISQYNSTLLQSIEEVTDSLSQWRSSQLRCLAHSKNLDDIQQLYELADLRWQHHIRDQESVLSIQKQWYDQKIISLQSSLAVAKAQIQLIKSLGGGYDGC